MKISTILFDLDGTLLDTAPDLATALNILLKRTHRPPLEFDQIRPIASHGTRGLLKLGLGIDEHHSDYATLRQQLLEIYHDHLTDNTCLFDGVEPLIKFIENKRLRWGIVTNKPSHLTSQLVQHFTPLQKAACVVSGDTTPNHKPHPEPLLYACQLLNCKSKDCVIVGDAERDIEAGRNAGMLTVVAKYGYINRQENITAWNSDYHINTPTELTDLLKSSLLRNGFLPSRE